jgi:membrane protease YdiL (CAAX protease family)
MPATTKAVKQKKGFDLEEWSLQTWQTTLKKLKPLTKNFWVFAWVVIALVGTQISLLTNQQVGVYVNAAAFIALAGLALWRGQFRQLAISAAILPVVNMITLSLPQSSIFAQSMVFYDGLLVLALLYRFMFTLDTPTAFTKLSAKGYAYALPLMVVAGQILGVIGYGLLHNHYTYYNVSLPLVAASSVVFAIAEESFFRGLIQQKASQVMNPIMAALLSVILYTFVSIGHLTILAPLFALLAGIVLSFTYYKKQNLILTITINAAMKLAYVGLMAGFVFR